MVMDTLQVRLDKTQIRWLDRIVERGMYPSRSEAVRDAVRRMWIDSFVGIIPDTGDSVKEVRELRKRMTFDDLRKANRVVGNVFRKHAGRNAR